MRDPNGTIYTNPVPIRQPIPNAPHPIKKIHSALTGLSNSLRDSVGTAKGEFRLAGDSVAFSFRTTPALQRLRIEVIHPVSVEVYVDGKVVPSAFEQDEYSIPPSRWNTPSTFVDALSVEKFYALFSKDGNLIGKPRFEHHVQSSSFLSRTVQDKYEGFMAGKYHGVEILEGVEGFGIQFLESIEDPALKDKAIQVLVQVRDLLSNPHDLFGPDATQPSLGHESLLNSLKFADYVSGSNGTGSGLTLG